MIFVWTLGDILAVLAAAILLVFVVYIWLVYTLPRLFRQARCKHDGSVRETMACEAICNDCGKNLGFIGAWRENHAPKEKL